MNPIRQRLASQSSLFFGPNSSVVVICSTRSNLYISREGVDHFYEVEVTSREGSGTKYDLSYFDPFHNESGVIKRNGDRLVLNEEEFERKVVPFSEINVYLLKNKREMIHCFYLSEQKIYISVTAGYKRDLESFRLFTGPSAEMGSLPIKQSYMQHTTKHFISYVGDELIIPVGEEATWNNFTLVAIPFKSKQYVESPSFVELFLSNFP